MVDIEHKSLELVKSNLGNLENLFSDRSRISEYMSVPSYIDDWNNDKAFKCYAEILIDTLNKGNINAIMGVLGKLDSIIAREQSGSEVSIFLCSLLKFGSFSKNVYEAYLLDQLIYIINVFSIEEIKKGVAFPGATNSIYIEEIRDLLKRATSREEFEVDLYKLKLKCKKKYLALLKNPENATKLISLHTALEELILIKQDTPYSLELYELLCRIVSRRALRGLPSEELGDGEQISFFP